MLIVWLLIHLTTTSSSSLWTWKRPVPQDYRNVGFGKVNRGPAILDDKLYVATLDCYLVALDIKSGAERWSTQVADYKLGYLFFAHLSVRGNVFVRRLKSRPD